MNINGKWMSETEVQAYVSELQELLKAAISEMIPDCCSYCIYSRSHDCSIANCRFKDLPEWTRKEEALKLIGGAEND